MTHPQTCDVSFTEIACRHNPIRKASIDPNRAVVVTQELSYEVTVEINPILSSSVG